MTQRPEDLPSQLQRARELCAGRAWLEAYELLSALDAAAPLELEDLWRLAFAASLCARESTGFAALERIYQQEHEQGSLPQAARAAFWLGFRLMHVGEISRANGWLTRAEKTLEKLSAPCVELGYLELPRIRKLYYGGDFAGAIEAATRAIEVAERFSDADLASFALNLQGRSLIRLGELEAGLKRHDEAMLAATGGELSETVTGLIYCSAIDSCQAVYEMGRVREWTASLKDWCDAQPQMSVFTGECQVHRAEVMALGGDWPGALEEARRAVSGIRELYGAQAAGGALYCVGELHRLRGELPAAEQLFREASQAGRDPQPGLALLRLAQGKADVAAQALRRAVGAATEPLTRVRLLPAQVEVALALGSAALDEASAAAADLNDIATRFGSALLRARALDAQGGVEMARGEPQAALGKLQLAFETWQELGVPYHAARTRVQLACAFQALGDEEGALLEITAARAALERLGAALDVAAIDALRSQAEAQHQSGLSARELEVLRLVAAGKTNKLIAAELCLSEKTVDRHVSNILGKLNVPSRAAATAFAYENKLV